MEGKRILALAVGLFMAGAATAALAQVQSQLTTRLAVRLDTNSDLDDPGLIRPSRPADGFHDWLTVADFPADLYPGEPYRGVGTQLRVRIGSDDRLISCEYQGDQSPWRDIGERACAVISQRGQFHHGIDAQGTAQPGTRFLSVSLQMLYNAETGAPGPAPAPSDARNLRPTLLNGADALLPTGIAATGPRPPALWLDISNRGRVTSCRIQTSTGSDDGDAALCRHGMALRFEPARTPEGERAATRAFYLLFQVPQ